MNEAIVENTFLETDWEKLAYLLVKNKAMITNRSEKYRNAKILPHEIDIEVALEENPRLLAPLIVLLVQHPINLERFQKIPDDILNTVLAIRKGEAKGEDCRYEKYRKLLKLCGIVKDKRVKEFGTRKIRKEWRLAPDVVEKINREVANGNFKNATDFVETLIREY